MYTTHLKVPFAICPPTSHQIMNFSLPPPLTQKGLLNPFVYGLQENETIYSYEELV